MTGMPYQQASPVDKADTIALRDLDRRWGRAYELARTRAGWIAHRLDTGRWLVAGSADELSGLIVADQAEQAAK
jgi:hypothetical protein